MKFVNFIDYSLIGFKDFGYGLCGCFCFFFYLKLLIRKEVYFFVVKYKLEMYYFIYRV